MSKSYKSDNKRKNKHKALQNEKIKAKNNALALTAEEEIEYSKKYGKGSVVKNTLKIWKESSPVTFMTYFPIVLSQLIFTLLWFLASIVMFIEPLRIYGLWARDFLLFFNALLAAIGIPLLLTFLHLRHNIKNKKYYFFNTLIYTLPAALLYVILEFVNVVIAVLFEDNRSKLISTQLDLSLIILIAMFGIVMIFSSVAQVILLFKRSKSDQNVTKLGVKLNDKKK